MSKRFPTDLSSRGVLKLTDKLLVHNIDTGVTQYTTVSEMLDALGLKGQVKFPAVQIPSANVNTLDDYKEENTLVPVLKFGGASVGITYGTQQGNYTKIGNRVLFTIRITLTNKGSSTGVATIDGLPSAGGATPVIVYINGVTFANIIEGFISGTIIYLREVTEAGVNTDIMDTDFANTSTIYISGQYKV